MAFSCVGLTKPFTQLLRNYTQNIDNIESRVGLKRIFQCHGSFATASCIVCRSRIPGSAIEENIFSHTIPWCEVCTKRQNKLRPTGGKRKSSGNPNGGSRVAKLIKKKRKSGWEEEDDEDGSDDSVRHIMKVREGKVAALSSVSSLICSCIVSPDLQPDITFFGEALHSNFNEMFLEDIKREDFDLLLIIGTSLKVSNPFMLGRLLR